MAEPVVDPDQPRVRDAATAPMLRLNGHNDWQDVWYRSIDNKCSDLVQGQRSSEDAESSQGGSCREFRSLRQRD